MRSATSSLDRFSASAVVSITGKEARTGTPSARRMASDLSLLSIASAEISPFSADALSPITPIPHTFQTHNITVPLRQRQDRASQSRPLDDRPCRNEVSEKTTLTDGVRRIDLYAIASSHAKSSLIAVIPDADFGWVVDLWSPTRDIPGALASHREFVAGLRKFGVMPTLWAGGHGTGAAPIKPLVEALDKK